MYSKDSCVSIHLWDWSAYNSAFDKRHEPGTAICCLSMSEWGRGSKRWTRAWLWMSMRLCTQTKRNRYNVCKPMEQWKCQQCQVIKLRCACWGGLHSHAACWECLLLQLQRLCLAAVWETSFQASTVLRQSRWCWYLLKPVFARERWSAHHAKVLHWETFFLHFFLCWNSILKDEYAEKWNSILKNACIHMCM